MKMLVTVKELFDKNDIEFWPIYGTLLGFVRDKDFIEWDYDIDIGAWYYDYDKICGLRKDFESAGYEFRCQKGRYSVITIGTPMYIDGITDGSRELGEDGLALDICFWIKDGDKAVSTLYKNNNFFAKMFDGLSRMLNQDHYFRRTTRLSVKTRNEIKKIVSFLPGRLYIFLSEMLHSLHMFTTIKLVMPYTEFSKLSIIKIHGLDFYIPSNSEQYLELSYGKDWRIPNKNWGYKDAEKVEKTFVKYLIKEKKNKILFRTRWNIDQ